MNVGICSFQGLTPGWKQAVASDWLFTGCQGTALTPARALEPLLQEAAEGRSGSVLQLSHHCIHQGHIHKALISANREYSHSCSCTSDSRITKEAFPEIDILPSKKLLCSVQPALFHVSPKSLCASLQDCDIKTLLSIAGWSTVIKLSDLSKKCSQS